MTGSSEVGTNIESLAAEIRTCDRCALAAGRTNAVPGDGAADTVVIFVGEGPGHAEDQQGLPFVGRSGQYLTQALNDAGIRREDVYITNVVKCRPPDNRDPLRQELEACSGYLDRQVELINPRIIVTLGRFSMRRWFPNGSITRIHGQVRNIGHGRVALAMFHPAAALRNPQWQEAFAQDMRKLPPLIERALIANRRAVLGEALPAGVPHPGDPDYVVQASPDSIVNELRTASVDDQEPTAETNASRCLDDDSEQLSLW